MKRLAGLARTWFVLGVTLGLLGLLVLEGTASGVVLAAAVIAIFVGVMRVLRNADMSGVTHGGEGGGFG